VVGIDRDVNALAVARDRVKADNISNVTFIEGDLSSQFPHLDFCDAAFGRRVLMYLPNPVDTIRHISAILKPNGVVAFQESDSTMVLGRVVSLPLHEKGNDWIWRTVEREGANIHMGFSLPSVFEKAGLLVESVRAEAIIQGQNTHYPLARIVRAMIPRIIQHGVATKTEIDIVTLEQRLKAERHPSVVYVSDIAFGAWARKP
jgi:SAM-dependent methyltransferase